MVNPAKHFKKSKRPFLMSDRKLINDFIEGKSEAFAGIYHRFKKPILRVISARIQNSDIAEELAQEVFMRVYRFRDQYDPEYEFSTWLWTVTKNVTLDYLSRAQLDPLMSRPAHGLGLELQDIICSAGSAETLFMKKTERVYLFQMLRKLPRLQRKAIVLRVMKGRSYSEIAKSLSLSLSAVKSLIHRGKISLQEIMLHRFDPIRLKGSLKNN